MIVCGPVPLKERFSKPVAALALVTGDASSRQNAWHRLDLGAESPQPADSGSRETVARRLG
jgi:hypothetical protein